MTPDQIDDQWPCGCGHKAVEHDETGCSNGWVYHPDGYATEDGCYCPWAVAPCA